MFMQRTSPHPALKSSWPRGCGRLWQSLHFFCLPCTCLLRFFTSIFLVSPCFWLQTFMSLGQMAVVNIQIGCAASTRGARTELPQQHVPCPSAWHMCTRAEALHGSWGGTWSLATQLLLWSRLKCGCHRKMCFGAISGVRKGLRLLYVAAGHFGASGPSWWGGKWAAEVPRMESCLVSV